MEKAVSKLDGAVESPRLKSKLPRSLRLGKPKKGEQDRMGWLEETLKQLDGGQSWHVES